LTPETRNKVSLKKIEEGGTKSGKGGTCALGRLQKEDLAIIDRIRAKRKNNRCTGKKVATVDYGVTKEGHEGKKDRGQQIGRWGGNPGL